MLEIYESQPLSVITGQYLDQISAFKINTTMSQAAPDNAKRQVLRNLFQPVILYLVDQGYAALAETWSPESVLKTVVGRTELQLDEDLVRAIRDQYCERTPDTPVIDWLAESLRISLADGTHPLKKLSQAVTGKLSDKARIELTKMGMGG